jgi:hypothetical protein
MTSASWLQPSLPRALDLSDHYVWAKDNGLYLDGALVVERITTWPQSVIVLDVRDDDAVGGHIAGALHWPDSTFDDRLTELLGLIRERQGIQKSPPQGVASTDEDNSPLDLLVVLHCMETRPTMCSQAISPCH